MIYNKVDAAELAEVAEVEGYRTSQANQIKSLLRIILKVRQITMISISEKDRFDIFWHICGLREAEEPFSSSWHKISQSFQSRFMGSAGFPTA
jgi:hypothetical protein